MINAMSKLHQNTFLLLYSFHLKMTPTSLRYVDQERQDIFSLKNTFKSVEFSNLKNTFVHLL